MKDSIIHDWEFWLIHHPRSAKRLLGEITCTFRVDERPNAAIRLPLDVLAHNTCQVASLLENLLTREKCGAFLRDMGFDLLDAMDAQGDVLHLARNGKIENAIRFNGPRRWHCALQWALGEWEKEGVRDKGLGISPEPEKAR